MGVMANRTKKKGHKPNTGFRHHHLHKSRRVQNPNILPGKTQNFSIVSGMSRPVQIVLFFFFITSLGLGIWIGVADPFNNGDKSTPSSSSSPSGSTGTPSISSNPSGSLNPTSPNDGRVQLKLKVGNKMQRLYVFVSVFIGIGVILIVGALLWLYFVAPGDEIEMMWIILFGSLLMCIGGFTGTGYISTNDDVKSVRAIFPNENYKKPGVKNGLGNYTFLGNSGWAGISLIFIIAILLWTFMGNKGITLPLDPFFLSYLFPEKKPDVIIPDLDDNNSDTSGQDGKNDVDEGNSGEGEEEEDDDGKV